TILSNPIFGNGALGIDLGGDGVTPNDPGDGDTGANNLQNFPVFPALSAAVSSGSSTIIQGTLDSAPNTSFLLQFFAVPVAPASGHGQGNVLLGGVTVMTDGTGQVAFRTAVSGALPLGSVISATATNLATGDTSEFSADSTSTLQFVVTNTNDSGPGSLR